MGFVSGSRIRHWGGGGRGGGEGGGGGTATCFLSMVAVREETLVALIYIVI